MMAISTIREALFLLGLFATIFTIILFESPPVFEVQRVISNKSGTITSNETSYYITSLDASAQELLYISRAHWKIESMHWMLDVDFSEDTCELLSENGQKSLNIFRKLALFIHKTYMAKQPKKRSIKSNLLRCLVSESAVLEVVRSL